MYKLVVSGFDNVLINSEEAISTSTMLEIDRIRNNGKLFVVSTDRSYSDVLEYNKDFTFIDYIIACNGAYLYDVRNDVVVYKKSINFSMLKKIINSFSDYNMYVVTDNGRFLVNDLIDNDIYMLEVECNSKKKLDSLCHQIASLDLEINTYIKKMGKIYYLQIIMGDIDKCIALKEICSLNNITLDEVVAFGADDRDISLFSIVGYKVAMRNATKSLKKVADKTTSSNDDKGVKKMLGCLFE